MELFCPPHLYPVAGGSAWGWGPSVTVRPPITHVRSADTLVSRSEDFRYQSGRRRVSPWSRRQVRYSYDAQDSDRQFLLLFLGPKPRVHVARSLEANGAPSIPPIEALASALATGHDAGQHGFHTTTSNQAPALKVDRPPRPANIKGAHRELHRTVSLAHLAPDGGTQSPRFLQKHTGNAQPFGLRAAGAGDRARSTWPTSPTT